MKNIHVATVHWQIPDWIIPQINQLKKYIDPNLKVYAFLNGINPKPYSAIFEYISFQEIISHSIKLNALADVILSRANDDDNLIFIDGDAYPVAPLQPLINELSVKTPLIAVKRLENDGDIQPHPSFCLTTVGLWRSIKGDWRSGYHWISSSGKKTTDVGGNLLKILNDNHINWKPLLRSDKNNLHKLYFAIYGNVIYHHGAGFRDPISRWDGANINRFTLAKLLKTLISKLPNRIETIVEYRLTQLSDYLIIKKNKKLSDKIKLLAVRNPELMLELLSTDSPNLLDHFIESTKQVGKISRDSDNTVQHGI